jgi:tetratricopeptide (TPR) repeat protein
MVSNAEESLLDLIKQFPNANAAKSGYMKLAEVYITDKRYDSAIEVLDKILAKYEGDIATLSKAHFLKALVYDKQGEWAKAYPELKILKDEFPTTLLGLQAPLYIAQHYVSSDNRGKAQEEYNRAAEYYERLRDQYKGMLMGYTAANFAVQSYAYLEKFEEAGSIIEDNIIDYPSTLTFQQQIPLIESIIIERLNSPDKAIKLYRMMIESTEDQRLEEYLHDRIGKLLDEG